MLGMLTVSDRERALPPSAVLYLPTFFNLLAWHSYPESARIFLRGPIISEGLRRRSEETPKSSV